MRSINGQLASTAPAVRAADERVHDFCEVSLGYTQEQAVSEASRCLDCKMRPCVEGCPVGVDIPGFVRAIADGDFPRGWESLRADNSLPAICGRVCPQETQCQGLCSRGRNGEPVGIGNLERWLADWAAEHDAPPATGPSPAGPSPAPHGSSPAQPSSPAGPSPAPGGGRKEGARSLAGRKVACVGSGPASLTCASALAAAGASVTIFEALHKPGGVLSYGIPEFRLPAHLVNREIEAIESAGVEMRLNCPIGRLFTTDELLGDLGFEAVFLGTGAGLPRYLNIDGEGLCGVCTANELLTRVNLMRAMDFPESGTPVHVGARCVVVGGGNVAMDAARTARRLGSEVTVVYRRGFEEMPARAEEVAHAREEGVAFELLAAPVRAIGDEHGWLRALDCRRMRLEGGSESERAHPVEVEGSDFCIDCDTLVVAVGTRPNPIIAQTTPGLAGPGSEQESTEGAEGIIAVDEASGATAVEGVFAGGDATTGAATVIRAMGAGKRAAAGIAEFLMQRQDTRGRS